MIWPQQLIEILAILIKLPLYSNTVFLSKCVYKAIQLEIPLQRIIGILTFVLYSLERKLFLFEVHSTQPT